MQAKRKKPPLLRMKMRTLLLRWAVCSAGNFHDQAGGLPKNKSRQASLFLDLIFDGGSTATFALQGSTLRGAPLNEDDTILDDKMGLDSWSLYHGVVSEAPEEACSKTVSEFAALLSINRF